MKKYYHYAYLFVQSELKSIANSIEMEPDSAIKQLLINRKLELENDLITLEALNQ